MSKPRKRDYVNDKLLLGTWYLTSLEVRPEAGGEATYWLGPDARGKLVYGEDGSLLVFLTARDRAPTTWRGFEPGIAEADAAKAYSSSMSYCGTYELRGTTMTHHIEFCSVPAWGDQVREVSFEGSNLVLSARGPVAGVPQVARLVWHRKDATAAPTN